MVMSRLGFRQPELHAKLKSPWSYILKFPLFTITTSRKFCLHEMVDKLHQKPYRVKKNVLCLLFDI